MKGRATGDLIRKAHAEGLALFAVAAALPDTGAPEWITLFPQLGRIETRDGRVYEVAAAPILDAFAKDKLEIPVDVNHATDLAALTGGRSDAVGWIAELRERAGALEGRVNWLPEGRELLAARKYRYISPSFYRDDLSRATRLKAAALVTAPALPRMPALASAQSTSSEDNFLPTVAAALGLDEGADLTACLNAIEVRRATSVPLSVHQAVVERFAAVSAELAQLEAEVRADKITTLIEGALSDRKITPAERDKFEALCATYEGLATIEALFAAMPSRLPASGLDERRPPGADRPMNSEDLAQAARAVQEEHATTGRSISIADAMTIVTTRRMH